MNAYDAFESDAPPPIRRIRPLRGRVVIREHKRASSIIEIVGGNPRDVKTHRGTVLAVGAPVLTSEGSEIPIGFEPGDVVQFHFEATEKGRLTTWGEHEDVLVMAQREIDAVIDDPDH